jgi:hypothetical protein
VNVGLPGVYLGVQEGHDGVFYVPGGCLGVRGMSGIFWGGYSGGSCVRVLILYK